VFKLLGLKIGLYGDMMTFWYNLADLGTPSENNVILCNDLNLTLNHRDICREVVRRNPPRDYFSYMFESFHLVDVELIKIVPTWRNV